MANERRLIDANYARETATIDLIVHHIDRQPTVDAVEVVRCRDCRFAHRVDGPREKYSCVNGNYFTPWFNGDDFCSRGERRCE